MTDLLEPSADLDAKRVCLFCKENGHDVTMQLCEGSSSERHYFCPCCDRLDPKFRGQFHLIQDVVLPEESGTPSEESDDDTEPDEDGPDD